MQKRITIDCGGGGAATRKLIQEVFGRKFRALGLQADTDGAVISTQMGSAVMTTDSHVVEPLFFRGGNIGLLAVTGTSNDLAVMGVEPKWLSCAFILGVGLEMATLELVAEEMAQAAMQQSISIVTGDTKVVEKVGESGFVCITTTGIGLPRSVSPWTPKRVRSGDHLIVTGNVGEHALAVLAARHDWESCHVQSDCKPLYSLLERLHDMEGVHFARDITRGGLAAVCNELAQETSLSIELIEEHIPVSEEVWGWCEVLGYDWLSLACEGSALIAVDASISGEVVSRLRSHPSGTNAAIVGIIFSASRPMVTMQTAVGGKRVIPFPSGTLFPRIC